MKHPFEEKMNQRESLDVIVKYYEEYSTKNPL